MNSTNARKSWIWLVLAMLPAVLPWILHPVPRLKLDDFGVYYTASTLAREHRGAAIYNGADAGADPQLIFADAGSTFAQTAQQLGIPKVRLYVYPPILADALIPLTFEPVMTADRIWTVINYAALAGVALLTASLMNLRPASLGTLAIFVGLLAAQPVVSCLTWGQVTVFLFFLWVLGTWLYSRHWIAASAFIFALATVVKLTPLIVIFPFLIWREWRWMRAFVLSLAVLGVMMALVNQPSTLVDYFSHVMPSMSHGVPSKSNESLLAAVQMLFVAVRGGIVYPMTMDIPHTVITVGKALSLLALAVAIFLAYSHGAKLAMRERVMTLALFAALSAPISPVSWPHAYAVCLLTLALLWGDALCGRASGAQTLLLFAATIAVTSYLVAFAMTYLVNHSRHELAIASLSLLTPGVVILLTLDKLRTLQVNMPATTA